MSGVGTTISVHMVRDAERAFTYTVSAPFAVVGTLSTRTSDSVGELTLPGHVLADGDTIDLYFADSIRYGVTVGTVAGDVVPISGGAGAVLPAELAAVTAGEQAPFNARLEGDDLEIFGCDFVDAVGHVDFGNVQVRVDEPELWDITAGDTNPLAGETLTSVAVSTSSTAGDATFVLMGLADAATTNVVDANAYALTDESSAILTTEDSTVLRAFG